MERVTQRLCLLFTPSLCSSVAAAWQTLDAAIAGGVDLVQWRVAEPDLDGLSECVKRCASAGVACIVNDHVELCTPSGAAGAHVGQGDLPAPLARARLGEGRWLGVSTHDLAQIDAAVAAGADYVGFGPVFPTATKGYTVGQSAHALRAALAHSSLPLFAIGGIDMHNIAELTAAGVQRIAVSAAILRASDPRAVARSLREALA